MATDHDQQTIADRTRIVLRPVGSALPLGFLAFGIGMLLLAAVGLGWVPTGDRTAVWLALLTFVAPLEFTASLWAFLARDGLGGAGLGLFAGSWATVGVIGLAIPGSGTNAGLGFYLVGFTVAVAILGVVARRGKPLLAAILLLAAIRSVLAAVYELTARRGPPGRGRLDRARHRRRCRVRRTGAPARGGAEPDRAAGVPSRGLGRVCPR